ncbi:ATP-grasp domain-containing protein [Flagellimonas sp.]|uniref:ATP-grasp domain-containing protein n=1 Tax=Flagellimonas sp. TaxID=2058762 RepID=UPI003B50C141
MFDVVVLTDSRFINPEKSNPLIANAILEDQLVIDALNNIGLRTIKKAWDDPNFDWKLTKYALFRSTWDCFNRFETFTAWFQQTKNVTRFINSHKLVSWNMDKHYLKDLEQNGINIPKTLYIEPGSQFNLKQAMDKARLQLGFESENLVLKPCIAGGARHTYMFHKDDWEKYDAVFQELTAVETMMLQEFQKNIVEEGEISIVLFNGKYAHAILKNAKPGDFRVQDDFGGSIQKYQPSKAEIEFATQVLHASPELPIYARVDIFRDNGGNLALAELEIFEPELWFRRYPEAAKVLATSIKEKLFN